MSKETYQAGDQDFSAQLTAIRAQPAGRDFHSRLLHRRRQHRAAGAKARHHGAAAGRRRLGLGQAGRDRRRRDQRLASTRIIIRIRTRIRACRISSRSTKSAFGETPDGLAALGYDAARILCDAIGRASSLSGADIAAELAKTKDFDGVTGKISIDADRNAVKPAVMLEMKDGVPTYVTTIEP